MFEPVYLFENSIFLVCEVRRSDIVSEDKSIIYHWFMINKEVHELVKLHFISMKQDRDLQQRTFVEGILEFDETNARFLGQLLPKSKSKEISDTHTQLIHQFFKD